jgi:stage V sporulation protein G
MNISEVRVSLVDGPDEQLLAFCTITFDRSFVVRDIRIIQGSNGPFVAMPSRRVTSNCGKCGTKNYLGSKFCAECGTRLPPVGQLKLPEKSRGFVDIAHPVNAKSREKIQTAVLEEFARELAKAQDPNYQPSPTDMEIIDRPGPTSPHWQVGQIGKKDKIEKQGS